LDVVPPLGKRSEAGSASGAILRAREGLIVEAAGSETEGAEEVGSELDKIESAARGSSFDLRTSGFWPLVARVKRDPALIEAYADRLGALDRAAFRSRVRPRVPVWAGNLLLSAGIALGGVLVAFAVRPSTDPSRAGVALIAAGLCWSVSFHCPSHWLVGRAVGIRFTDYFLGGPPPPRPGLKTDLATYLRATPQRRAWMHASGAIATKLAPFLALAFWTSSDAPWWSAAILVAIGAVQIGTDVAFSVRSSDWMRFRREMAIARAWDGSAR
jgi:hypothetical protein